jgi:hypothetical protein
MSISCWEGPDLVVRVLDGDAELAQRKDDVAAEVGRHVERREVEIAARSTGR